MAAAIAEDVRVEDIELHAENLDAKKAAAIYKEHGALVVRGLMKPYAEQIRKDIEACVGQALELYDQAQKNENGWHTPDGTLWIPAPKGYARERQIMIPPCRYNTSAAFFRSAYDAKTLDIVESILGPNLELFMDGQCLYKEPVGGHAKHLHQDAAYFEHKFEGPCATLNYTVDTNLENGALYVMPGTHKLGVVPHIDTSSHLGLDEHEWPWERALPICGKAGDAIFFHVKTVHGSKANHSKASRPVFIHRYRSSDDYVVINATSVAKRDVAQKQVESAKKENQMGLMVRGRRVFNPKRGNE